MIVRDAQNVFRNNEIFVLPNVPEHQAAPRIGVFEFMDCRPHNSTAQEVRAKVIEAALATLRQGLPAWSMWLFACHWAWQPATRLSAVKKLWGSLQSRSLAIPAGQKTEEIRLESDAGVRWFGAARLGAEDVQLAIRIVNAEAASVVAVLPSDTVVDVRRVCNHGWQDLNTRSMAAWRDVAVTICELGGVLLRPFGECDDREVGTYLLAQADLMDSIRSVVPPGVNGCRPPASD